MGRRNSNAPSGAPHLILSTTGFTRGYILLPHPGQKLIRNLSREKPYTPFSRFEFCFFSKIF